MTSRSTLNQRIDNHLDGFSERQYGWQNKPTPTTQRRRRDEIVRRIDLRSNNNVTVLTDDRDKVVYQKRLTKHLPLILEQLSPYASSIEGIVVESTYNWYWLVDGLMEKGHRVYLANTAAIQQYEGLKYTDDDSDARWLAHLFRLGVLPEGYIYPKEERAVR